MNPTLQEILEDAKLVAAHGARSGAFARDEPLMDALSAALAKGNALSWADPEFARLQGALSQATRAIAPVTLYDLKSGWRSDQDATPAGARRVARKAVKCAVLVLTIALLFTCAVSTIWQQQAKHVLSQFAQKKEQLQSAAVNDLFPLISTLDGEDPGKIGDPSSGIRLALRAKALEISTLDAAIMEDIADVSALMNDVPLHGPLKTAQAMWASLWIDDVGFASAAPSDPGVGAAGAPPVEPVAAEVPTEDETLRQMASMEVDGARPATEIGWGKSQSNFEKLEMILSDATSDSATPDPCAARAAGEGGLAAALGAVPPPSDMRIYAAVIENDVAHFERIRCHLGLRYLPTPIGHLVQAGIVQVDLGNISHSVAVFDFWLLPAMYGMLGALVFHLRNYLNNLRPDPSPLKVILRVGLGGFAGVAVGWFWLPKDGQSLGIADITLTTLSFAFLVGFAIDVFFNLLDRLVTILNGWVGKLGAPAR